MPDTGTVLTGCAALAECEKKNGIQKVRLAFTILTDETVQLRREDKVGLSDVLVVKYGDVTECHNAFFAEKQCKGNVKTQKKRNNVLKS